MVVSIESLKKEEQRASAFAKGFRSLSEAGPIYQSILEELEGHLDSEERVQLYCDVHNGLGVIETEQLRSADTTGRLETWKARTGKINDSRLRELSNVARCLALSHAKRTFDGIEEAESVLLALTLSSQDIIRHFAPYIHLEKGNLKRYRFFHDSASALYRTALKDLKRNEENFARDEIWFAHGFIANQCELMEHFSVTDDGYVKDIAQHVQKEIARRRDRVRKHPLFKAYYDKYLGLMCVVLDEQDYGFHLLRDATERFKDIGSEKGRLYCIYTRGTAALYSGERSLAQGKTNKAIEYFAVAKERYEEASRAAGQHGMRRLLLLCEWNLGRTLYYLGDSEGAKEQLTKAKSLNDHEFWSGIIGDNCAKYQNAIRYGKSDVPSEPVRHLKRIAKWVASDLRLGEQEDIVYRPFPAKPLRDVDDSNAEREILGYVEGKFGSDYGDISRDLGLPLTQVIRVCDLLYSRDMIAYR